MSDSYGLLILLQVFLIALNAIFACAEIAVLSINDVKLQRLAADGDKRAVRLARLTNQPARFLATIQVAITLSGFLGSAFAAENFSDPIVDWIIGLGVTISPVTLNTIAVMVITLILSYITLVFGELVPKRMAMRNAEKLALGISGLISIISKAFAPIVWLLTVSTNGILRLLGIDPNAEDEEVSEEEILMMVDAGSEAGAIDPEEQQLIQNVFEFDDIPAIEFATHRTDLCVLWQEESLEEWDETIRSNRYSLYPICNEVIDQIVGVLSTKEYFRIENPTKEKVLEKAVKPAYFVPESVKADVLFKNMKRSRNNLAIVLDEYGGVSGIVTINDLVELLVGEIEEDEPVGTPDPVEIEKIDDVTWRIHGSASLEDLSEELGIELPSEDYDTFNGLVFDALGAIPDDGTTVEVETNGLHILVTEIREHQVECSIVTLLKKEEDESEEE